MKLKLIFVTFLVTVLAPACGPSATAPAEPTPDVAAVRTSAASTVVSQFTLTAAAFTPTVGAPTETPEPDVTATQTTAAIAQVTNAEGTVVTLCDKYAWDLDTVDVNIPDNTIMSPGQDFIKTWKIKNIGACTWGAGYELVFSYGEEMQGEAQPLEAAVAPGQEVEVSVQFTAPDLVGSYFSFWTLQNDKGITFLGNDDKALYVQILVQ
ncbi:MAG TPA: NBR1-Ig-like domain-containing protein [Anaerolineales bacterium]|nr:NBR1-Ig-like domain-containing protein [Anaerolineales bacterium]